MLVPSRGASRKEPVMGQPAAFFEIIAVFADPDGNPVGLWS